VSSPSLGHLRTWGTLLNDQDPPIKESQDPLHAQERTPQLIIMVHGTDSVLPDVLAIHTIEMIPKSMILPHFRRFEVFT